MNGNKEKIMSNISSCTHKQNKAIINRISRVCGHLASIKKMIEENRDCKDILIQLAACKMAVNNIGKLYLNDHINNCVKNAINQGDQTIIEDLNDIINKFIK